MKSIHLSNSIAKIEIAPSLGGAILAYEAKIKGEFLPILRQANQAKTVLESSCFPLVPYSNRIKHGQFTYLEKKITLPLNHFPEKHSIHGHGWQLPWEIIDKTETSLTLQYHYQTAEWPYSYSATQVFILEHNTLNITLSIINTANNNMPAGLGLHPYFSLTKDTLIQCSVDKMWAVDDESMPTSLVSPPKNIKSAEGLLIAGSKLDNVFTGFAGEATITWPEWQAKANITTSSNCQFIVIYSPDGEDYFCFEPVTHCTDAINMANKGLKNTGINYLKPQEKMTVSMRISVEDIAN
jgi:aldose 1-epimerase